MACSVATGTLNKLASNSSANLRQGTQCLKVKGQFHPPTEGRYRPRRASQREETDKSDRLCLDKGGFSIRAGSALQWVSSQAGDAEEARRARERSVDAISKRWNFLSIVPDTGAFSCFGLFRMMLWVAFLRAFHFARSSLKAPPRRGCEGAWPFGESAGSRVEASFRSLFAVA